MWTLRLLRWILPALALLALACDDTPAPRRGAPPEAIAPREPPAPAKPRPALVLSSAAGHDEGAPTAAAVFDRARDALVRRDYPSFVRCIAPATRRRWIEDVAFAAALESRENPAEHDLGARKKRAAMREILRVFGARATLADEPLSVGVVTERLLAEVRDPEGLLAALLSFAQAHDAPFDPIRALDPTGIDGVTSEGEGRPAPSARASRPGPVGSAATAGLRRLGGRLEAAAELGELDAKDPARPTALIKVNGEVAPVVLRFVCDAGVCFLDES